MKCGSLIFLAVNAELGSDDFSSVFHIGKTYTIGGDMSRVESCTVIPNGKIPKDILRSIQGDVDIFAVGMF